MSTQLVPFGLSVVNGLALFMARQADLSTCIQVTISMHLGRG